MREACGGECKDCGETVLFVRTEYGSTMPINWDPDPAGNVVLMEVDRRTYARVLGKGAERPACVLWMPHHATCPASKPREEDARAR